MTPTRFLWSVLLLAAFAGPLAAQEPWHRSPASATVCDPALMDERFARVWDRFASDDEARSLAYATLNARLEGMNEFRAQLDKQAGTLVTREAVELRTHTIEDRISKLENGAANLEGRLWMLGLFVIAAQLALEYLRRRSKSEGP